MLAQQLLERLIALWPAFLSYWDSPTNDFREDDGAFTCCGVFAEFSHLCRERPSELPAHSLKELSSLLTECMDGSEELDSAASTCFLENISGEPFAVRLLPYLSGEPRRFLSQFRD